MSKWISVNDRLPEMKESYKGGPKCVRVLVFNGFYVSEGKYEETYVKREARWCAFGRNARVTHWMPLPDPPSKGEK